MTKRGFYSFQAVSQLLVVLLCFVNAVNGLGLALIGIDFGTKYIKVGVVQPGKSFEIALNEASKRKTENIVSFNIMPTVTDDSDDLQAIERLFSTDGAGMRTKRPQSAYSNLKSLISLKEITPDALASSTGISYVTSIDDKQDIMFAEFKKANGEILKFSVEELVAMILDFSRTTAENFVSEGEDEVVKISDCVITVPSFFNDFQRRAIINAAEIAGLNVLSLVNENSAASINFAVYKDFEPLVTEEEPKKEIVVFYNMGHANTQISVVEYGARNNTNAGKSLIGKSKQTVIPVVRVLSHVSKENFGGQIFDAFIEDQLEEDFIKANGEEMKAFLDEDPRIRSRLLIQANKVKEILSANDHIPVSVESLAAEKDLRTQLSRAQLEKYVHPSGSKVSEIVQGLVEEALSDAGIEAAKVTAVELLGGAVRMPQIKNSIDNVFKTLCGSHVEVGQHLNGDEAMALGAVFSAANISKTFRVKRLEFSDISKGSYSVTLANLEQDEDIEDDEAWQKSTNLFEDRAILGTKKAVGFTHDSDIIIQVGHVLPQSEVERVVASFSVTKISDLVSKYGEDYRTLEEAQANVTQKPKISLTFAVTLDSIIDLVKAEATFTQEIEVKKKLKKANKEEKNVTEAENSTSDEEASEEKKAEDETVEEDEYEIKVKEKKHKFPLKIEFLSHNVDSGVMSSEKVDAAKKRLKAFKTIEAGRQLHAVETNNLEGLIFAARDRLRSQDGLQEVVSEEVLEKFFDELEAIEDWLYEEEAKTCDVEVLLEKKKYINEMVNVYIEAYTEHVVRADLVKGTKSFIAKAKTKVSSIADARPWLAEKHQEKIDKLQEILLNFETYFTDIVAQQSKLASHDTPAFTSKDITSRLEEVQYLFEQLLKIKKPAPVKAKDPAEKSEESTSANSTESEGETTAESTDEDDLRSSETETGGDKEESPGHSEQSTQEQEATESSGTSEAESAEKDEL